MVRSTRTAQWRSANGSQARSSRNGCASAATGIRAAAFRSTCSGKPADCRRACGFRIRASHPIADGDELKKPLEVSTGPDNHRASADFAFVPNSGGDRTPHSITSSARASTVPGISSASACNCSGNYLHHQANHPSEHYYCCPKDARIHTKHNHTDRYKSR
jgi:hypothetical protein